MAIQRVASKWAKTQVLLQNQQVSPYIPLTQKYTRATLGNMLENTPLVYIKPDRGTYGNGVMNVQRHGEPDAPAGEQPAEGPPCTGVEYTLRYGIRSETYANLDALHLAILRHTRGKFYIIQQGIVTLKYEERQFDLRILTQKTPYRNWETTGIIGRVAAKNMIITNYHGGGSVRLLNELLEGNVSPEEAPHLERKLYELGVATAQQLQTKFPGIKEIGLDVAIDEQLNPWILEVNTLPAIFPFKKFFKDKSIYRRIERYAINYGRLPGRSKRRGSY